MPTFEKRTLVWVLHPIFATPKCLFSLKANLRYEMGHFSLNEHLSKARFLCKLIPHSMRGFTWQLVQRIGRSRTRIGRKTPSSVRILANSATLMHSVGVEYLGDFRMRCCILMVACADGSNSGSGIF
jgi:hypothetical protein